MELIKMLIQYGAKVDPAGCRPIFVAIARRNLSTIKYLKS